MNEYENCFCLAVIIGLGGFLIGLDTAVISAAEQENPGTMNLDALDQGLIIPKS